MGIVIDTSALFKLFYEEKDSDKMDALMQLLINQSEQVYSIDLILYELGQIVIRKHRMKAVMARDFPQRLSAMNIDIQFPDEGFIRSAMDIGKKLDISFYDSCFIAISERLDLPLITEDSEILKKFPNSMSISNAYDKFSKMLMRNSISS
ncbi:MAG: type II toxin-antitoxin system VapC family toxin [Candidatus Thermoplasmatota archaeon]|nr:type II toxin-antitoxin system VapC family toxin [Candidatus Thermoplasmatota archaeon]